MIVEIGFDSVRARSICQTVGVCVFDCWGEFQSNEKVERRKMKKEKQVESVDPLFGCTVAGVRD